MSMRSMVCVITVTLLTLPSMAAGPTEKISNDKVRVVEQTLAPGEVVTLPADRASAVVYLQDGSIQMTAPGGKPQALTVKRGEVVFQPRTGVFQNAGASPLRIVLTEFLGKGGPETWGRTGLAADYTVLFENQYARVYDIKVSAGKTEPLHSHKDRIVICLSGAELEHEMSDGHRETATLKTGEIVWRKGVTHIGHNIGKTDLWAIAIEPK